MAVDIRDFMAKVMRQTSEIQDRDECLDCGHIGDHTEDCALSFGDAFAQREGEVEVK